MNRKMNGSQCYGVSITFKIKSSLADKVDECWKSHDYCSRTEFIEKALECYVNQVQSDESCAKYDADFPLQSNTIYPKFIEPTVYDFINIDFIESISVIDNADGFFSVQFRLTSGKEYVDPSPYLTYSGAMQYIRMFTEKMCEGGKYLISRPELNTIRDKSHTCDVDTNCKLQTVREMYLDTINNQNKYPIKEIARSVYKETGIPCTTIQIMTYFKQCGYVNICLRRTGNDTFSYFYTRLSKGMDEGVLAKTGKAAAQFRITEKGKQMFIEYMKQENMRCKND